MSSTTREEVKRMSQRIAAREKRVVVASDTVGRRGVVLAASRRDRAAVDYYDGPACRTRNRKKRKLGPIYDDPISNSDDDDVVTSVRLLEEPIGPADSKMPEKRVLELVLDILWRRDTYELFGEPVKDEEGKQYYEKVKEAMDFGTMRAKLHEGMYTNLDQFERDVCLITENAMNFNAKSTIFFRQGRTIHELAKRVFHLLRSDPKGFESRVSKTRHAIGWSDRWTRETRNSRSRRTAPAANQALRFRSSGFTGSVSPSPICRRRVRKDVPGRIDAYARDRIRPNSSDPDHRFSYRPCTAFLSDKGSVLTTFCNELRPTIQGRQHDIGYRESLMMFCKDLGLIAQKVALRKLQALQSAEAPSSSRNPISVPDLSFEPPPRSCRIPCPSKSEQLMAIVPVSRPPIPADRPYRLTVLGLTNTKASSLNRDTGENPRPVAAPKSGLEVRARTRADPLPLTVYLRDDIDLDRRAMANFDLGPQLNISSPGLTDFPNGRPSGQGHGQVKQADAPEFSFHLPYLKAKLVEMNSKVMERLVQPKMNPDKELQIVQNFYDFPLHF